MIEKHKSLEHSPVSSFSDFDLLDSPSESFIIMTVFTAYTVDTKVCLLHIY